MSCFSLFFTGVFVFVGVTFRKPPNYSGMLLGPFGSFGSSTDHTLDFGSECRVTTCDTDAFPHFCTQS